MICQTCKVKCNEVEPLKNVFSNSFTAYAELSDGDGVCISCAELIKDKRSRSNNWIKTKQGVDFFKREEVLEKLQNIEDTPFVFYTTQTYKTQGFLNILNRPNYNLDNFVVGMDRQIINVDKNDIEPCLDVIYESRDKKFTKQELLTQPYTHRWQYRELCNKILQLKKLPVWRLLVFAV